jgi:Phosphopantetheine attachment site
MDLSPYLNRSGDFESMSDREKMIAKVFGSVLSVPLDELSGHSDFFLLGGDSIKAIIFSQQCLLEGLGISSKDLFMRRTIKLLARHAEIAQKEELCEIMIR